MKKNKFGDVGKLVGAQYQQLQPDQLKVRSFEFFTE
jgi:hypothetical protein